GRLGLESVPLESRMRRKVPVRFGGGWLETYHYRRASARTNSSGNALAIYPIAEVTDSSSVSPTKKAASGKSLFSALLLLERRCPYSLITGAVNTCSLPNATLRVNQFCLVLGQQARYLLQ